MLKVAAFPVRLVLWALTGLDGLTFLGAMTEPSLGAGIAASVAAVVLAGLWWIAKRLLLNRIPTGRHGTARRAGRGHAHGGPAGTGHGERDSN